MPSTEEKIMTLRMMASDEHTDLKELDRYLYHDCICDDKILRPIIPLVIDKVVAKDKGAHRYNSYYHASIYHEYNKWDNLTEEHHLKWFSLVMDSSYVLREEVYYVARKFKTVQELRIFLHKFFGGKKFKFDQGYFDGVCRILKESTNLIEDAKNVADIATLYAKTKEELYHLSNDFMVDSVEHFDEKMRTCYFTLLPHLSRRRQIDSISRWLINVILYNNYKMFSQMIEYIEMNRDPSITYLNIRIGSLASQINNGKIPLPDPDEEAQYHMLGMVINKISKTAFRKLIKKINDRNVGDILKDMRTLMRRSKKPIV